MNSLIAAKWCSHFGRQFGGVLQKLTYFYHTILKAGIQSSALGRMFLKYCLTMKGDIDCMAGHTVWRKKQGYSWESLTQKKKAWVSVGREHMGERRVRPKPEAVREIQPRTCRQKNNLLSRPAFSPLEKLATWSGGSTHSIECPLCSRSLFMLRMHASALHESGAPIHEGVHPWGWIQREVVPLMWVH